jgi:2-polyprenyl-6-hydroxyphenyl methylase/3-demethylubiquinone-9 3-methyltransferase
MTFNFNFIPGFKNITFGINDKSRAHNAHIFTKKILDVGCGGGILAESLALEGAIVTGIDMAEAGLEVAKLHLLESGLEVDYQKIQG